MATLSATLPSSYRPSGRIAWYAPIAVLALGLPAALVLAAIYSLIVRYNPLVYFTCLATFAFGGLLGAVVAKACKLGVSRSRAFNMAAGLVIGAFGLWLHWLIWSTLMFDDKGEVARHLATGGPGDWSRFFAYVAENHHVSLGRFSSDRAELSPGFLTWTWRAEALAVLLLSALVPLTAIGPYSEALRKWATKDWAGEFPVTPSTPMGRTEIEQRLAAEGVDWLAALSADRELAGKVPGVRLQLTCESVRGDASCAFISLHKVTKRPGKSDTNSSLVSHRRLDGGTYERLLKALAGSGPGPSQAAWGRS
jgi:hypothetical protein